MNIFYGVFNLDFFHLVLPPFCISSGLKFIHIALFGYISIFYPMLLICVTWISVELHGRNFRPLVCLWRPFHQCFVRLRRGWNTKSDLTDVFATFFLLSYSKCAYQTLLLLTGKDIINFEESGDLETSYHRVLLDLSITLNSTTYLLFVTPAALIFIVFNILPPLLLTLYPIKAFRSCLSKYRLNFIVVNIFVDKVHGCYRNGLDGGRDMRSFSGLYFLLRTLVYLTGFLSVKLSKDNIWLSNNMWFPAGSLFLIITLSIALVRPYKKAYMNYLDTLLLSNLAVACYVISSGFNMLLMTSILFLSPIVAFIVTILLRSITFHVKTVSQKCCKCCNFKAPFTKQAQKSKVNAQSAEEQQPLIQPLY